MGDRNDGKYRNLIQKVKFVHAKYRYEIEVPNDMVKNDKLLDEMVLTS